MLEWRQTGGARELFGVGPGSLPREDGTRRTCDSASQSGWYSPGCGWSIPPWPAASTPRILVAGCSPASRFFKTWPHRQAAQRVCAHQLPGSRRVLGDTAIPIPSRVSPEAAFPRRVTICIENDSGSDGVGVSRYPAAGTSRGQWLWFQFHPGHIPTGIHGLSPAPQAATRSSQPETYKPRANPEADTLHRKGKKRKKKRKVRDHQNFLAHAVPGRVEMAHLRIPTPCITYPRYVLVCSGSPFPRSSA